MATFFYNPSIHSPKQVLDFIGEKGYHFELIECGDSTIARIKGTGVRVFIKGIRDYKIMAEKQNAPYNFPSISMDTISRADAYASCMEDTYLADHRAEVEKAYEAAKNEGIRLYQSLRRRFLAGDESVGVVLDTDDANTFPRIRKESRLDMKYTWWESGLLEQHYTYNPTNTSYLDICKDKATKWKIHDQRPLGGVYAIEEDRGLVVQLPDSEIKTDFLSVYWQPYASSLYKIFLDSLNMHRAGTQELWEEFCEWKAFMQKSLETQLSCSLHDGSTALVKDWDMVEEFMERGGKKGWLSKLLG
jgi:hypothetical protein